MPIKKNKVKLSEEERERLGNSEHKSDAWQFSAEDARISPKSLNPVMCNE